MISTAQTGYFYTTQRLRQGPSLSAVKYDPRGAPAPNSSLTKSNALSSKIACPVCREQEDVQKVTILFPYTQVHPHNIPLFGQTITPDGVNTQHGPEGCVNVTAFVSSVYKLQEGFLRRPSIHNLGAVMNVTPCETSLLRCLAWKGRRNYTFSMLAVSSGKAALINCFSESVILPKGKILETPLG
jgi:hypothetical protein